MSSGRTPTAKKAEAINPAVYGMVSVTRAAKVDTRKFSKLLVNHCIEKQFLIPPQDFLQDLDAFANGEVKEEDIIAALEHSSMDQDEQQTQVLED